MCIRDSLNRALSLDTTAALSTPKCTGPSLLMACRTPAVSALVDETCLPPRGPHQAQPPAL
eukprot:2599224-Alexandrium_andersonii.AAC.1